MKFLLTLSALSFFGYQLQAQFLVTNTNDSGAGSLRQAISSANASGGGNISFSNILGTITLTNGELQITQNVNIIGPGPTLLTISGNSTYRIFSINAGVISSISGLTIADGKAPLQDSGYPQNCFGGGVYNGGNTIINNCVINNNISGGNDASGGNGQGTGGGVYNYGTLVLRNSSISGNIVRSDSSCGDNCFGGGVCNVGNMTIELCVIANNRCSDGARVCISGTGQGGLGAGVYNASSLVINQCSIGGNRTGRGADTGGSGAGGRGGDGGAIYNTGTLKVFNSNISFNFCGGGGSGIPFPRYGSQDWGGGNGGSGAGIWNSGMASITTCTIGSNYPGGGGVGGYDGTLPQPGGQGGNGGGLYNVGTLSVTNSTIAGNSVGVGGYGPLGPAPNGTGGGIFGGSAVRNSIISDGMSGNFTSWGYNLILHTNNTIGFGHSGDLIGVDPLLGPLADHGGPTFTMALLPGSPAIDAGTGIGAPQTDQRGVFRPQGSGVDIGAFELESSIQYPFPQLTGMAISNAAFRFVLHGPVCSLYVIQVSSNLLDWSALLTNTILASGMLSLIDPSSASQPRLFYRAVPLDRTAAVAGTVTAWGQNTLGQTNVPVGLTNAVAIAGGVYHSLVVRSDGTVTGWGENDFGQTNPPVGLSNVIAVAAGWGSSLALKCDGTLEEWGWDGGYGLYSTAHALSNVTAISATWDCLMALQSDGKPLVWGKSTHGETNIPSGLVNVVAIAGGGDHCMALKKDGSVVVWGDNGYNQTNIPAGLGNVKAIAAGGGHCLALKTDGTVVAWGNNSFGLTNVPAGLTNVVAISAGSSHSLALKADGTVVVWGDNSFGQTNSPANLTNVFSISAGGFHNLAIKH